MNKTKNIIEGIIILVLLFITIVTAINLFERSPSVQGISQSGSGHFSTLSATGTTTGKLLAANTSTQMVASSSAREYSEISNLMGFSIYCNADADKPAVLYSGIMVAASSTIKFTQDFPYTGGIRCIAPATASTTVYSNN